MSNDQVKSVWGKLVPLSKGLSTYALKDDLVVIGRSDSCRIIIKDKRLSGSHCTIIKENNQLYLEDNSTNGTWLFNKKIDKKVKVQLKNESQIWLLPISKVSKDQIMGFKLIYLGEFLKQTYKNTEQDQKILSQKKQEEQTKHVEELKTSNFMNSLRQQISCPYCSQIMLFPVCIQPCNHRMCGHCLTQLVNLKKDSCIICRKQMISAARDAAFNSIIDDYFRSHPSERKEEEDNVVNIFGYQPKNIQMIIKGTEGAEEIKKDRIFQMEVQKQHLSEQLQRSPSKGKRQKQSKKQGKTQQKPRASRKKYNPKKNFINSDISASTDNEQSFQDLIPKAMCKECSQERNNFKCDKNQVHVNCHNCNKVFAKRQGQKLYQCCTICNGYFCNLYFPPCQKGGVHLSLLGKRSESCRLEEIYFRGNKVEMDAFRNLLISEKKTEKSAFNEMLQLAEAGRFEYLVHRKILRNPPPVQKTIQLHKKSPICDNCWRQVWFQMIFMFVKENAYLMPESIKGRMTCHYGVNCRTMVHNVDHAKKYNHMEFQSRFK